MFNIFVKSFDLKWHFAPFEIIICVRCFCCDCLICYCIYCLSIVVVAIVVVDFLAGKRLVEQQIDGVANENT